MSLFNVGLFEGLLLFIGPEIFTALVRLYGGHCRGGIVPLTADGSCARLRRAVAGLIGLTCGSLSAGVGSLRTAVAVDKRSVFRSCGAGLCGVNVSADIRRTGLFRRLSGLRRLRGLLCGSNGLCRGLCLFNGRCYGLCFAHGLRNSLCGCRGLSRNFGQRL